MNIDKKLRQIKKNNIFKDYIHYIRFPNFKNLENGLRIEFSFPVTAITGPNGSNKSSILRALQACPEGNSISDFWFETALDQIDEDSSRSSNPQRYIFGYQLPSNNFGEVVKTRVRRKARDYEYWEPGKVRPGDGMPPVSGLPLEDEEYATTTRWKGINKNIIYLDFRSELPAFDILMSFNHRKDTHSGDRNSKKNTIRRYSRNLKKDIELQQTHELWNKERIFTQAFKLKGNELKYVSQILGRNYSEISLVEHDYFDYRGWTVLLRTSQGSQYSEAFSGSGEFAAVMLVHKILQSEDHSLILLDEPETSLHPGAQAELVYFLKEASKLKKLQVILSTHSTNIIENLPADGIKALDISPGSNKVILKSQSSSKSEAFCRIGAPTTKKTIYLEDKLAKYLVQFAVEKNLTQEVCNSIKFDYLGAGADSIRTTYLQGYSSSGSDVYVIFDGDQRKYKLKPCLELDNESSRSIMDIFGKLNINLNLEGGNDPNIAKKHEERIKEFISWYKEHVSFLPGITNPENQLLFFLDPDFKREHEYLAISKDHACSMNCLSQEDSSCLPPPNGSDGKEKWIQRTKEALDQDEVNSNEILHEQRRAIAKLYQDNNPKFIEFLKNISDEIYSWID